jgi:outer membrane protein assembly factor BamB
MPFPRGAVLLCTVALSAGCALGCAGPSGRSPQSSRLPASGRSAGLGARAGPATGWPSYHHDAARTGYAPGLPPAGPLSAAWSARLDGAVYGQPLVVGGIVVAATENDTLYGLNRVTGRVLWRAHLGSPVPLSAQPCGDIDPLGITGTPVYDPASRLVYAVAQITGSRHLLAGVDPGTGAVRVRRLVPAPDGHPAYDQQRAALAAADGRIYVAFGGHFGDCGPYVGSVSAVPASGRGAIVSYRVPTARLGGIWAPAGPVIGTSGTVYVSVGNGAATHPPYDGSDSVVALSARDLRRTQFFAPLSWAADNAADLDLGSSSPVLLPGGRILAVGKRGTGYLLNAAHLGGVGGQVAQAQVCPSFGGAANSGSTAYVPCASGGLATVSAAGGRLRVLWRGPPGAAGSPVLGGGAVWVTDYSSGTLYELSPATGRVRHQIGLGGALPHFASPSLSGRLVLVGTLTGVTAVSGA